ncbi:hypothetical protein NDU88_002321 [Pleurodeles waltl]|uniref:Secreted protein n=1 Tax=Pleurodeles waltl TaxID=8319 RepID=A0AAV7SEG8_PLEWA|nr:hypothetical protein NDU88_002321 [Pleurodeles waltl]
MQRPVREAYFALLLLRMKTVLAIATLERGNDELARLGLESVSYRSRQQARASPPVALGEYLLFTHKGPAWVPWCPRVASLILTLRRAPRARDGAHGEKQKRAGELWWLRGPLGAINGERKAWEYKDVLHGFERHHT